MDALLGHTAQRLLCLALVFASYATSKGLTTEEQDAVLFRYRQSYTSATTAAERDSIKQEIRWAIQDARIDAGRGQEQLQLWELCCSDWMVRELGEGDSGTATLPTLSANGKTSTWSVDVVRTADTTEDVTLLTSDHVQSRDGNTVFLASNRYPGYGGIDLYTSDCHHYVFQGVYRWLYPRNLGKDVNTGADEYDLRLTSGGFTFARRENGVERLFEATPRSIVNSVSVTETCAGEPVIIMNVRNCEGRFTTSVGFDEWTVARLPIDAQTLSFKCCARGVERRFKRCEVTIDRLTLEDIDIRTHDCNASATLTQHHEAVRFGISIYEDAGSINAALASITESCSAYPSATVTISTVPGHLGSALTDFVDHLLVRGLSVVLAPVSGQRTVIDVAAAKP
jgi:hypothetical protein